MERSRLKNLIIDEDGNTRVKGCDAEYPAPVYMNNDGDGYICRCVICAHCKKHTGNSNQGHYWAFCNVLARTKPRKTSETLNHYLDRISREYHFCCPGNCELYHEDGTRREPPVVND